MSTEAKIPEADLKNVNLKPTETVEKVILPSAEGKFAVVKVGEIAKITGTSICLENSRVYSWIYLDVNRERVPLDAASFQKENLKKVTPIVNDQVQRESSILVSLFIVV